MKRLAVSAARRCGAKWELSSAHQQSEGGDGESGCNTKQKCRDDFNVDAPRKIWRRIYYLHRRKLQFHFGKFIINKQNDEWREEEKNKRIKCTRTRCHQTIHTENFCLRAPSTHTHTRSIVIVDCVAVSAEYLYIQENKKMASRSLLSPTKPNNEISSWGNGDETMRPTKDQKYSKNLN